ncbi:MAG: polysaccharide deacetylase family protein [Candidatus Nitrosocosmicus sp.]
MNADLKIYFCIVFTFLITISFLSIYFNVYGIIGQHKCNCIVFRLDDVQDDWLNKAQIDLMNLFISKNQSFSLGLIMNATGNDDALISKIKEGYNKGLFELALHGYDHINFSKSNDYDQYMFLKMANQKMKILFGNYSKIFIPPYDAFNNGTLNAMYKIGIPILSSFAYEEYNIYHNNSLLISNGNTNENNITINKVYHIPGSIGYKNFLNGTWIKNPLGNITNNISEDIDSKGYSVIVLHPQDFSEIDKNGSFVNSTNENEINDLSMLIDYLLLKNYNIVTFSKIMNIENSYR